MIDVSALLDCDRPSSLGLISVFYWAVTDLPH